MLSWRPGPSPLRIRVTRLEHTAADHGTLPHCHEPFVLMYFERGGGEHRCGAAVARPKPGDVTVLAPGEAHDSSGLGAVRGWELSFMLDAVLPPAGGEAGPATVPPRVPLPGDPRWGFLARGRAREDCTYRVPREERCTWSRLLRGLAREIEEQRPGYPEAARAHLTLVLVSLTRIALDGLGHDTRIDPVVAEVFDFIETRYAEPVSLRDVARALARSPSHLTRIVRELTGRTVMHWLGERRMLEARRLLVQTDLAAATIGERVGYRDPRYFRRRFRAIHGIPPHAWRQLNR